MKNPVVESGLRWTLAAWMLLAMPLSSLTFVHQHAGGDASHHHETADHTPLPPAAPLALDDDHRTDLGISTVDAHCHGCLPLLGTVTYQSGAGNPSDSHEKVPRCLDAAVVLTLSGARAVSTIMAVNHLLPIAPTAVVLDSVGESTLPISCHFAIAPASLLCDRARHERSGVLLT
jgi:hypothetical protein